MSNALEDAVYEQLQLEQDLKPPKRNNLKRKLNKEEQEYRRHVKKERKRSRENPCKYCETTLPLALGTADSEYVCQGCGLVNHKRVTSFVAYNRDGYSIRARSNSNAQLNYFNERLGQWRMQEPPIPHADMASIRETYNSPDKGPYDPFLPKEEVRKIIIDAGLAPKVYVEKWLTIRVALGAEPHPIPSPALVEDIRFRFKAFQKVWAEHPEVHPRRVSLPNYNFLIHNFLLLKSAAVYELYSPWFPSLTHSKVSQLIQPWFACCRILDWDLLVVDWTPEGTPRVFRLQPIDTFFSRRSRR